MVFDATRKSLYWMLAGILITMTVFAFAIILSMFQSSQLEIPEEFEAEILALRFTHSEDCFAYKDVKTGRVFPNTIDPVKLNKDQLRRCYQTSSSSQGLKAFNFGIEVDGFTQKPLMTNNFILNRVKFELPKKNVFVKSGDQFVETQMKISVSR
ncbi:hypothetical protein HOD05_02495 [Candidatus Woesearchaeota archaeon]|mgnify:FL=1|jgi:hypothetical protein|nr:hypothetical protein [Candidatus Woesearchaeota archaeon]MBT4150771.1 hypothetical protein [Candidatus Woesearchaeota archaeon]MBT4247079.1 hypothetical protein [Candidatus Woesearchaeota archaeon]MBT4434066.1 hypothetical protein [Candidatus Woesearchaeota archaeon]MBT7331943.1 hypothetical protein [Candidatus Woesearchaeota archaeon]